MAASPEFKVYSEHGVYLAATRYLEDAAAIIAAHGTSGMTIRWGHRKQDTLWCEGAEDFPACESYDGVAEVALGRRAYLRGDVASH